MGEAAVAAARAVGYQNAGTVEFLVATARTAFYFMEMNTRLQVEHPVTEMITGLDLVEWQLEVAAGEPLPCRQDELAIRGHAIEVADLRRGPGAGLPAVDRQAPPPARRPRRAPHVRIESGVRAGDEVGIHYDPMLAKLIVWDEDRTRRARAGSGPRSLATRWSASPPTSSSSAAIAAHPAFAAGEIDTGFIERHRAELLSPPGPAPDPVLAIGALSELLRVQAEAAAQAARSLDPHSPWHQASGWRLNDDNLHTLELARWRSQVRVTARYRPGPRPPRPAGRHRPGERCARARRPASLRSRRRRGSATVVRTGRGADHLQPVRAPSAAGP